MTSTTTEAPSLPLVPNARVSGYVLAAGGPKNFAEGYVREVYDGTGGASALVEVVHGHAATMGTRRIDAHMLTVVAVPDENVVRAAAALAGAEVEATVTVDRGFGHLSTERGFVGLSNEGGDVALVWVTDGRGSGAGYEVANVRSITVGAA